MLRRSALFGPKSLQKRSINVFSEFAKSVSRQIKENEQLQKDIKQLEGEKNRVAESDAMKNAKKAVEATGKVTQKVIGVVGTAVDATLNNPAVKVTGKVISETARIVSDTSAKVAEPILETKAAKTVASGIKSVKKDVVGITGNAYYVEYQPKEERDKQRTEYYAHKSAQLGYKVGPQGLPLSEGPIEENTESTGIVMHKSGKFTQAWEQFKSESPIAQKIYEYKRNMEENDSFIFRLWRNMKAKTTLSESETLIVVKAFKAVDPTFDEHTFLNEAAHYMIPDILDAYIAADATELKAWFNEVQFAAISHGFDIQKKAGIKSDCKLIDYRNCQIQKMVLLNDEIPLIILSFATTEILCFKDRKGAVTIGAEDNLQNARYVVAFTKANLLDSEAKIDPKTNGWLVVEWHRQVA